MAVVKWYPHQDVTSFQDGVNRLFDNFFRSPRGESELTSTAWVPPVDIYGTKDEVVLKVELPEINIKDVKINAENNVLSISGERKFSDEVKEESYFRIERTYGPFVRTFTLPASVDATKISAKYKDGVLRLVLPKKEESKPRQVTLEIEKD